MVELHHFIDDPSEYALSTSLLGGHLEEKFILFFYDLEGMPPLQDVDHALSFILEAHVGYLLFMNEIGHKFLAIEVIQNFDNQLSSPILLMNSQDKKLVYLC